MQEQKTGEICGQQHSTPASILPATLIFLDKGSSTEQHSERIRGEHKRERETEEEIERNREREREKGVYMCTCEREEGEEERGSVNVCVRER